MKQELLVSYEEDFLNDDVDYIETPSKELAEQWLDAKIEALQKIYDIMVEDGLPLSYGYVEDGSFEYEIQPCGFAYYTFNKQIQIYKGIEYLSELLEITLYHREKESYFLYKGYTVFQLDK